MPAFATATEQLHHPRCGALFPSVGCASSFNTFCVHVYATLFSSNINQVSSTDEVAARIARRQCLAMFRSEQSSNRKPPRPVPCSPNEHQNQCGRTRFVPAFRYLTTTSQRPKAIGENITSHHQNGVKHFSTRTCVSNTGRPRIKG